MTPAPRDVSPTASKVLQSLHGVNTVAQREGSTPTVHLTERDLYVASRDAGGTFHIHTRTRSYEEMRIQRVRERDDMPFKCTAEVIRAALHLGLCVMEGANVTAGAWKATEILNRIEAEHELMKSVDTAIDRLHLVMRENDKRGCHGSSKRLVLEMMAGIRDGDFPPDYRRRFLNRLDTEFGKRLEEGAMGFLPGVVGEGGDAEVVEFDPTDKDVKWEE